jgi:hypothetical protein
MKVAIVGAGRNRNGIGQYIGKYFQQNGASVISVLGTTEKTAHNASSILKQYGINATSYTDFDKMVEKEKPDTVVIASPTPTHCEYLIKSIEVGLHIFCEKPFIWHEKGDMGGLLENIFKMAESKNLKIAMNAQWPFSLPYYEELCGTINSEKIDSFFIRLSPMCEGKEMIVESTPHALSILYYIFGKGEIINLDIEPHEEKMIIKFNYSSNTKAYNVLIRLVKREFQPREFSFGFNDKIVKRSLDLESYDIYFNHANRTVKIVDPLDLSVQDFISAVKEQREPLIGKSHIINNTNLLKQIYDSCELT